MAERSKIMLAVPFNPKVLDTWEKPFIVQPKLNGRRCRALLFDKNPQLRSSSNQEITSVPHINKELLKLQDVFPEAFLNTVFDGELYTHGMHKEDIDSICSRTVNLHPDHKNVKFYIFDLIAYTVPNRIRAKLISGLSEVLLKYDIKYINIVKSAFVRSYNQASHLLNEYIRLKYEGIILRNPNGLYVEKRTTDMMKVKPTKNDTYTIQGVIEEVSIHGEPKDTLGAFIVSSERSDELFKVGSGPMLTKDLRKKYWENKESIIGKQVLIKYQELSNKRGVPIHPVLIEIL